MPYNLSEAFEAIEDELISSMMRNLKRHQAEETDLGFEWEQWQALQLKALEDYRRRNLKKFPPRFNKLNLQIDEMLRGSYKDGRTAQERRILQAIRRGFKAPKLPYGGEMELEGNFFGVNDRKLDALLNAVNNDMNRVEYAVLRRADDQYRQVIFNAQVYANTGAGTYKKAVDMATRDFLRAGLDCVEYSNGSRHTLEDYADMAIKTANKRAYLQGEGSMRDEWGVPTVIMNKRNCPCPRCLPFVGKVFIDDVWSGADKSGISPVTGLRYPLMSDAIAQGLYHPRCKDVHSTYFEGISTPPEGSQYTADELDEMAQQYEAEQKQGYCERQEKRYDRMSRYSLDEDNRRIYGARAKAYGEKAEGFKRLSDSIGKVSENSKPKITDANTVVDRKIIDSSDYRRIFNNLGESPKVTRSIFQEVKKMLTHRSGGYFEDLSFVDSMTGKFLTRSDYNHERQCLPSKAMKKMVEKSKPNTIIGIHNHPSSTVPSMDDIMCVWERKQKYGIIACHNGNVYKYRVLGEFDQSFVDMQLDRLNAIIYNKNKLGDTFQTKIEETLESLKQNNIEMEVFLWG